MTRRQTIAQSAVLASVGWLLLQLGRASITIPIGSMDELTTWLQDSSPGVMAAALARAAALVACGYLGLLVGLSVLADMAGWTRLAVLVAHATPRALRRAATGGAQLGLAAGAVLGPMTPVAAGRAAPIEEPPATTVMARLEPTAAQASPVPVTVTMVLLGPAGEVPPAMPSPAPTPTGTATRVVGAGDSFWSIAEAVLAERTGSGGPDENQIARYWRQLIDANRHGLVAPGQPDLLIPGQILVLPPEEGR